jgi:2-keto-4-pentenoate hydratase/2-oxohepta-3-ene-1,7-dioic acid hydratase in catechol pathway
MKLEFPRGGARGVSMRLITFRDAAGTRIGVLQGEQVIDVSKLADRDPTKQLARVAVDMLALIEAGEAAQQHLQAVLPEAEAAGALLGADTVEILAPIPRPRKNVFCVGRNYIEHAIESLRATGQEIVVPESPNIFTKAVTTVTGPYADIPFDPTVSSQIDWEVELAVVMGEAGRHIPLETALAHVFGYTVLNDITARDIQHRPGIQWFQGKSLDGSCPIGPCLVTADEIPDPQALRLHLEVNGSTKQDSSTSLMLFNVAVLIARLSELLTLEPGDIIATGTPAGVGYGRTPKEFLAPGDVMESSIEGIGTMRNRVVLVERRQEDERIG